MVRYDLCFDGVVFHSLQTKARERRLMLNPYDLEDFLLDEMDSGDIEALLEANVALTILPNLEDFVIEFEFSDHQEKHMKSKKPKKLKDFQRGEELLPSGRYDMKLRLANGRATRTIPIMLRGHPHRFLMPANRELGDFIPIPTGIDKMFERHSRARVVNMECTKSGRCFLTVRADWFQNYAPCDSWIEEKIDVTKIYDEVCKQLNSTHSSEHVTHALSSIKHGTVEFWLGENKSFDDDRKAVRTWIRNCCKKIRSERILEIPQVRHTRATPASAEANSDESSEDEEEGEDHEEDEEEDDAEEEEEEEEEDASDEQVEEQDERNNNEHEEEGKPDNKSSRPYEPSEPAQHAVERGDMNKADERDVMLTDQLTKQMTTATLPKSSQDVQKLLLQAQQRAREGQARFREEVLKRCGARCIITGVSVPEALEAAHLVAFADRDLVPKIPVMDARNGVALRADLHKLFDSSDRLLAFRLCRGSDGKDNVVKLKLHSKLHAYLPGMHDTVVTAFPIKSIDFLHVKLRIQDCLDKKNRQAVIAASATETKQKKRKRDHL